MDGGSRAPLITYGMSIVVLLSALMAGLPPNVGRGVDPTKLLILAVQGAIVGVMLFLGRRRSLEE